MGEQPMGSWRSLSHIEGPVETLSEALRKQLECHTPKRDFITSPWRFGARQQSLKTTYNNDPAKFVLCGDLERSELAAGRFDYGSGKQIIVVAIPKETRTGQLQQVVVKHTKSRKEPTSSDRCSGHYWNVWRPSDLGDGYYEGIPKKILRAEYPRHRVQGQVLDGQESNSVTTLDKVNNESAHKSDDDHGVNEEKRSPINGFSSGSKRKRVPDTKLDRLPDPRKESRIASNSCQGPICPKPSDNPDKATTVTEETNARNPGSAVLGPRKATVAQVQSGEEPQSSPVEGNIGTRVNCLTDGRTIPDPPQNQGAANNQDLRHDDTCIKEEISDINTIDFTIKSEKPDNFDNVKVRFMDNNGRSTRVVSFNECKTATNLFEEACAWGAADRKTRMLEITMPGMKVNPIRKDNDDHFECNVLRPLRELVAKRGRSAAITLTVQEFL